MFITLTQAKDHARIDGTDEDVAIAPMMAAANAYVAQAIGPLPEGYAPEAMATSAALLIFADLYMNREAQSDRPLSANKTADALLAMCRNYAGFIA